MILYYVYLDSYFTPTILPASHGEPSPPTTSTHLHLQQRRRRKIQLHNPGCSDSETLVVRQWRRHAKSEISTHLTALGPNSVPYTYAWHSINRRGTAEWYATVQIPQVLIDDLGMQWTGLDVIHGAVDVSRDNCLRKQQILMTLNSPEWYCEPV